MDHSNGSRIDRPEGSLVGSGVSRREDDALLTGRAEFTDDRDASGMAHLAFVRSQYGHADIDAIDVSPALDHDGVLGAFTWADVRDSGTPGRLPIATDPLDCEPPGHPMLARDRVRYHGQPIAAVIAEDPYRAHDAAGAVAVEYDRRETVTDPITSASADAPTLFEAAPDNVAAVREMGDREATDEAFAEAAHVTELDLVNNRLIANAMEPRVAIARPDHADDRLVVELASQTPHGHRRDIAHTLGLAERELQVIAPAVGGGFGHKGHHYPGEAVTAWCGDYLDRPVKWTATRSENYLAGAHGRDHRTHAELAVEPDGTIQGLRAKTHAAVGGYGLGGGAALPGWYGLLLSGQYAIPTIHCETRAVFVNTAPVHAYRGAGRPEAIYVVERLVDAAARELGLDPVALRRRNLIDPERFPHETPVGAVYDSGNYERALDTALDAVDYQERREREDEGHDGPRGEHDPKPDADGRYRGVGIGCYVESTGGGFESGVVRAHPDGGITVYAGTHSHGQGHATTYAQIVADELGIAYDDVAVVEGDTEQVPTGTGTFGSRSTITGGNALAESAREVADKAREIAADRLEAAPEDLAIEGGEIQVRGAPDRSIPFSAVADAAYGGERPDGMEPGLEATTFYEQDDTAYSFGAHVACVAVDPDTGEVEIERYLATDDCGQRVNPLIVDGQIHGGVAQGIGQARYEGAIYDDNAQLVTGSMQDYAVPQAADLPHIETEATVTPSPTNDLGVKGVGEAGTIAAPPAVVNAVVDALAPLGIEHVDMPLTEERVWRAIHDES